MRIDLLAADNSMYHDVWNELEEQLDRASEAFADVAVDLVHRTLEESFEAEQVDGEAWAPLAVKTVAERERLGYGGAHPILVRTGSLKRALTESSDPHQSMDIRGSGGDRSIRIGTDDPRFEWHQTGAGLYPARPMWPEGVGEQLLTTRLTSAFIGIVEAME